MGEKTHAERIRTLEALCEQLEALRKQAEEVCRVATTEIGLARRRAQRERRTKTTRVKRERRTKQT